MSLSGAFEMALTFLLFGGIWLAGVVLIKAADRFERRRTLALARRRAERVAADRASRASATFISP
jgi:hypothetical protein